MAKIKINGDSSGYVEIAAPNAAHNNTLELGPGTKILTDKNTHIGNIGIGTDNPSRKIHINSGSTDTAMLIESTDGDVQINLKDVDSSDGVSIGCDQDDFYVRTGLTVERIRIDSSGRVLISDAATAGPMETFGSAVLQVATTAGGTLVLGRNDSSVSTDNGIGSIYFDVNDSSGNAWNETARITVNADGDHANNDYPSRMEFYTTGDGEATPSERLRITSAGRLTVTPADTTSSYATTDGGLDIAQTISSTGTSNSQSIGIQFSLTKSGQTGAIAAIGAVREGSGLSALVFRTRDNSTGRNERMRIMSDGTVKIGTGTGNPILMLSASTSGTSVIQMGDTADNNIGQIHYANSDDSMRFFTNNTENLRITSNGMVRVTDSASLSFGNNDDMRIFHDGGSANYIDVYNKDLYIRCNKDAGITGGDIILQPKSGENSAIFRDNGNVELYYDNALKLETVSNGTKTTGRIFLNGTNGGFDYNNTAHTLEFLVSNGTTHSELTHNAYVPSASNTRHLGYANKRWATLYVDKIAFGGSANTDQHSLDDYEEGTYTPTYQNFTTTGTSTLVGKYVKVGRQVTVGIKWSCTGTIAYSTSAFISLPFSMTYGQEYNGLIGMLHNSNSTSQTSGKSGVQCKLDGEGGSRFFPGNFTTTSSGESLLFGGTYIAAS